MKFDFAEAGARELGEAIEKVRAVFLAGKEPAVARRPAVAIAKFAERRIALGPRVDARAADVFGSTTPQGFVMIAEREQDVACSGGAGRARSPHEMPPVVGQPGVKVLLAKSR